MSKAYPSFGDMIDDAIGGPNPIRDLRDELTAAKAEAARLRGILDGYISTAITVRDQNTPEWMIGFVEDTNGTLAAIGDPDRVFMDQGLIRVERGEAEATRGKGFASSLRWLAAREKRAAAGELEKLLDIVHGSIDQQVLGDMLQAFDRLRAEADAMEAKNA